MQDEIEKLLDKYRECMDKCFDRIQESDDEKDVRFLAGMISGLRTAVLDLHPILAADETDNKIEKILEELNEKRTLVLEDREGWDKNSPHNCMCIGRIEAIEEMISYIQSILEEDADE